MEKTEERLEIKGLNVIVGKSKVFFLIFLLIRIRDSEIFRLVI